MEFTLLAAALTGTLAAWIAVRVTPESRARSGFDLLLGAVGVGILGGRLAAMVAGGVNPIVHPGDIIVVRGGVDTVAASLSSIAFVAWTERDRIPSALDALAPAAAAGLAGWHAGCVWRTGCLGARSSVPWAMTLPGSDVGRHPVELYTAAILAVVAVAAWRLRARPWLATGCVVAGSALSRLFTSPLRLSLDPTPTRFLIAGVVVGLSMVGVAVARRPVDAGRVTTGR